MLVAEGGEFVCRAAQVERTGRFQVRHQDGLLGAEDFRRLAHEAHAGHHQGPGRMVAAEARHFQRVGDAAAGFLGQVLQLGVDIVVGDQHRLFLFQQAPDAVFQFRLFLRRWRGGDLGPGVGGAGGAVLRVVVFEGFDGDVHRSGFVNEYKNGAGSAAPVECADGTAVHDANMGRFNRCPGW